MRRLGGVTVVAVALAACGAPAPRDRCSGEAGCGAGQYCAEGGVCWPDAVAPVIEAVTVSCPVPCLRDSTLAVAVTAHDDVGLAAVTARLDLAPATAVALSLQGGSWRGDLPLGTWPFPAFERAVEVTVEARDAAGNAVTAARTVAGVTRLRWAVEFAPGEVVIPGAVAVDDQGTAIFGGSNGKVYYMGTAGVATRTPVVVGTGALTAPVVVGSDGVWVPSEDGKVYRVPVDVGATVEMACNTNGPVKGLSLTSAGDGVAASTSGRFYSVHGASCAGNSPSYTGELQFQPPADGTFFFGAEGNNLRRYLLDAFGIPNESWSSPASLPAPIAAPLALRAGGDVIALTGAAAGTTLFAISPAGTVTPLAATGPPADGPVVAAGGDLLVPETGKTLSRWSSAGALRWRSAPLPGVPLTPLLLAGADALVVADRHGDLTALDAAGQLRWTAPLAPGARPLHPPGLYAPAGAARSTGYFPAENGRLYAVILDGRLDAAAPWPKPFHDPRNTGNAATPQPP